MQNMGAGTLLEVHDDHVVLTSDPEDKASRMRATRESRPVVPQRMCADAP